MYDKRDIELLKKLTVADRADRVIIRKNADGDVLIIIALKDSEAVRYTDTVASYIAFNDQCGWFQYESDMNQHVTTQVRNETLGMNEDVDVNIPFHSWGVIAFADVKGFNMAYDPDIEAWNIECCGVESTLPFHFHTRKECELVRDELVEQWMRTKEI